MKRYLLFSVVCLILLPYIFFSIKTKQHIIKNEETIKIFNHIFEKKELNIDINYKNRPSVIINGIDYIGIISTEKDRNIPVNSTCSSLNSLCYYSSEPFVILGTISNDSLKNYKSYEIDDNIFFTNSFGIVSQYKIKKIKRIKKIEEISKYNGDLKVAIKNYYNFEYILLICQFS